MPEKKFTKIFFRVFPEEKMQWNYVKILDDHKTVYVRCLQDLMKSNKDVMPTFWNFQADRVFYEESQQEIYDCVMSDVLSNLSRGLDAIIVAYGQTGSGKSLTMSGVQQSYNSRGILPRIVSDLFEKKKLTTTRSNKTCFKISFIEISKTTVRDLLQPYPCTVSSIKDVTKVNVNSVDTTLEYIFRGEGRKEYSENPKYPSHSFSSIFTFYITENDKNIQGGEKRECKIHIIDLAGADTIGNFSCMFKKPREVGSANLAKTQLEQFFLILSTNIPERIKLKYRLNPLIQYLGDSLSSSNVLRFIGHIKILRENLLVTLSMLRFGEKVGNLKASKYEINIKNQDLHLKKMQNLQNELDKLRYKSKSVALIMNQTANTTFDVERFAHVHRTINEYLQDKITEVTVLNVCEANIALETLKLICKACEEEKEKTDDNTLQQKSATKNHSSHEQLTSRPPSKMANLLVKRSMSHGEEGRCLSAPLKDSSTSVSKRKTSRSSLRRSSTARRSSLNSQSSLNSKEKQKIKSNSATHAIPVDVPPEYEEAWNLYKVEKEDEYNNFVEIYERNKNEAKTAYKAYLKHLTAFKEAASNMQKIKSDLVTVEMTKELRSIEGGGDNKNLERCLAEQLKTLEAGQVEKRELILANQAILKVSLNACKGVSQQLKNKFEGYCKEKYQMPLFDGSLDGAFDLLHIEDIVQEEENEMDTLFEDNSAVEKYEQFKHLIAIEQKKKKLYLLKRKEWTFY